MNILITGGTGFLGAHLGKHLAALGHRVVLYDNRPLNVEPKTPNLADVRGDVLDANILASTLRDYQVEVVIHLATMLTAACEQNPAQGTEVNCQGAANVFDVASKSGVRRVIFGSSVAVFDDDPTLTTGDDRPCRPSSIYGATKVYVETLACAMSKTRPQTKFIGLRFGWIYGPGRDRGWVEIQEMIEQFALDHSTVRYPQFQKASDWTYVDDAVEAIVRCLDIQAPTQVVYNVSGDYRPIDDAVAHLQTLFPHTRAEPYPANLPPVAWHFKSDRIIDDVKFNYRIPLEEGLTHTVNAIRQLHHLPLLP